MDWLEAGAIFGILLVASVVNRYLGYRSGRRLGYQDGYDVGYAEATREQWRAHKTYVDEAHEIKYGIPLAKRWRRDSDSGDIAHTVTGSEHEDTLPSIEALKHQRLWEELEALGDNVDKALRDP